MSETEPELTWQASEDKYLYKDVECWNNKKNKITLY